jgi:hypothetical protein
VIAYARSAPGVITNRNDTAQNAMTAANGMNHRLHDRRTADVRREGRVVPNEKNVLSKFAATGRV